MSTVQLNGITLHYESIGTGDPLVLIAGFASDHLSWRPVVKFFSQQYRVVTFDNRGAGQSSVPDGDYSIEQMADDTAALCDYLGIKQAAFIGHSMGGMILQALMHYHAPLVKHAVISQSGVKLTMVYQYFKQARLELMKAQAPISSLIKAELAWCFSHHFLSQGHAFEDLAEFWSLNPHPFTITGFEGQLAALKAISTKDWLMAMSMPTLVLTGDEDIVLPLRCSQPLMDLMPHVQSYPFSQCGHIAHMEYPELFATVVCDFLS